MPSCTVAGGPHPCFEVVYANGSQPAVDPVWSLESAVDTQIAHAIAQDADILLIEAEDNLLPELFSAIDVAVARKASVVNMSWGVPEGPGEAQLDYHFDIPGVAFVAATGDSGHFVHYPAVSSKVLACGGTTLYLDRWGRRRAPK